MFFGGERVGREMATLNRLPDNGPDGARYHMYQPSSDFNRIEAMASVMEAEKLSQDVVCCVLLCEVPRQCIPQLLSTIGQTTIGSMEV